ncbi:MAG: MBL fold metallo-hydrolase [Deltaproteobacteria bacterium]|nr:MBL fold metallo-hydrolase [Deltaproteobacteria bacterium]
MAKNVSVPLKITPNFYRLGTTSFPVYLSVGKDAMIIEGGTSATAKIVVDQIDALGVNPETIKYIALTHTHADHIGAIPHLKFLWPHIKVIVSSAGADVLSVMCSQNSLSEFKWVDNNISALMLSKGEIEEIPSAPETYNFAPDIVVKEGDRVDLGNGVVWSVYDTPGHSACHIAWYEEGERILVIGDATGFYAPSQDTFWPNYFDSLEKYVNSIRKLSSIAARQGVLSHNYITHDSLDDYFKKALAAAEAYHKEMIDRLNAGEDPDVLAVEKAKWVNSLTDIQPYKVMLNLSRLLIMQSRKENSKNCF